MKGSLTILLVSMLLVFSLSACGKNTNNVQTTDDPPVTDQDTGSDHQENNTGNDTLPNHDALTGEPGQQTDATATPDDSGTNNNIGVSYEQMLRNGRVHDSDGLLHDGENTVRDIADGVIDIARSGKNAINDLAR